MSTLSDVERDRLLEAGRRLLSERRKKALSQSQTANASMPSVAQPYVSNENSTLPPTIGTTSLPSSPAKPLPYQPPKEFVSNSPYSTSQPTGYPTPPRTPEHNFPNTTGSPLRSSTENQSPRDANLQKRVSELTLERSEISAKLFKQEKANEEILAQNNLLRQRVTSFEKSMGNNQLLQDRIDLLESQNKKLEENLEKMKENHEHERQQWSSTCQAMEENTSTVDSLLQEKLQLENKLKENLQTFQESLDERNQREQVLNRRIEEQKKQVDEISDDRRRWKEKANAAISENELLKENLTEKEQQLSILYKESAQTQRASQETRSLLNQKNELIQQLKAQLSTIASEKENVESQLVSEKDKVQKLQFSMQQLQATLQEKTQELERSEENYKRLYDEKSSVVDKRTDVMQEMIGNKVDTMNQLQEKIEVLSEENQKLRVTIEQYQELLDNMQSTSNQISLSYDHTITQMKKKYEDDIRHLLQSNNQLQSQLRALQSQGTTVQSKSADISKELANCSQLLEKLELLRKQHRQYKPEPSITLEEVQEQKIHQLLEEVAIMEDLVKEAGVVEKIKKVGADMEEINNLRKKLQDSQELLDFTVKEKKALLDAIESGDLSAFMELQQEAQKKSVNVQEAQKEQVNGQGIQKEGKQDEQNDDSGVNNENNKVSDITPKSRMKQELEGEPEIEVVQTPKASGTNKQTNKKKGWFW